jgi:tyrosyl-tRNA synthetase
VTTPREPDEQLPRLMRGVDTLAPEEAFEEKLREGRPLRVKLGLDPTAPAVTLGWAVVLRKLRHFQELGHTAVLIVGDFTAQVGDPSGRSETRKRLSREEVGRYAESVLEQFRAVLLPEPLEVRYNSEWLASMDMGDVLELTSKATVAQMLERSDFADRYETGIPISVMEFLYPLLQGYDSVAVEADVELGGSDQLWNLMMGRVVQERYGLPAQVALTMPLLIGTDGTQKMSQSLGNYIGIREPAEEMFGKTMSIPDELMGQWFRLATEIPSDEIDAVFGALESGDLHPGEAKRRLAREIVDLYHGPGSGDEAEAAFDRVFRRHEVPEEIDEHELSADDPVSLPALIRDAGLASSGGEARRLLEQGAVKLDGERVDDLAIARDRLVGAVLQVGKRRFVRLR